MAQRGNCTTATPPAAASASAGAHDSPSRRPPVVFRPMATGCRSPIYCTGPLLEAVQTAQIFTDSKTFVDMPTAHHPDVVLASFQALRLQHGAKIPRDRLRRFVAENFLPPGSDLVPAKAKDWRPSPSFLHRIRDPAAQQWALALHSRWGDLLRSFRHSEHCHECHSSLPVKRPFLIPGGRFLENYYWDTYWVIQGLIVSEMFETTKDILLNLLDMVADYGFVPNGARVYYLNRSQPPLLAHMVKLYLDATNDNDFLHYALPYLDREYRFWIQERSIEILNDPLTHAMVAKPALFGGDGDSSDVSFDPFSPLHKKQRLLSVFRADADGPRPESYLEDLMTASMASSVDRLSLFSNLATGAETGWDYSSRWLKDGQSLSTIRARDIIPVDLNAIMLMNERHLAAMHLQAGNPTRSELYQSAARSRVEAIHAVLFDPDDGTWYDRNWITMDRTRGFYISNLFPIWADAYDPTVVSNATIRRSLSEMLHVFQYPGGVPASLRRTGQQWDFPNAWAPLQAIVFHVLKRASSLCDASDPTREIAATAAAADVDDASLYREQAVPDGVRIDGTDDGSHPTTPKKTDASQGSGWRDAVCQSSEVNLAEDIGRRWLISNFCAWRGKNANGTAGCVIDGSCGGAMYEKYDATRIGRPGGGGEYLVQDGFGWTNGVALALLVEHGDTLNLSDACPMEEGELDAMQAMITATHPFPASPLEDNDFPLAASALALLACLSLIMSGAIAFLRFTSNSRKLYSFLPSASEATHPSMLEKNLVKANEAANS